MRSKRTLSCFIFGGGFKFSKLDFTNKIIMAFFRVKLSLTKNKTPDERGMLAAYSKPIDCTRKENIKGIVEYVQSLSGNK